MALIWRDSFAVVVVVGGLGATTIHGASCELRNGRRPPLTPRSPQGAGPVPVALFREGAHATDLSVCLYLSRVALTSDDKGKAVAME